MARRVPRFRSWQPRGEEFRRGLVVQLLFAPLRVLLWAVVKLLDG